MRSTHRIRSVTEKYVQQSNIFNFKDVYERMSTLCLHGFGSCLYIDAHMLRVTAIVLAHADLTPSQLRNGRRALTLIEQEM